MTSAGLASALEPSDHSIVVVYMDLHRIDRCSVSFSHTRFYLWALFFESHVTPVTVFSSCTQPVCPIWFTVLLIRSRSFSMPHYLILFSLWLAARLLLEGSLDTQFSRSCCTYIRC